MYSHDFKPNYQNFNLVDELLSPLKKLFEDQANSKGVSLVMKIDPYMYIHQLYHSNQEITKENQQTSNIESIKSMKKLVIASDNAIMIR